MCLTPLEEAGVMRISMLQMRELRLREGKRLALSHTAENGKARLEPSLTWGASS